MRGRAAGWKWLLGVVPALCVALSCALPAAASASLDPAEAITYLPGGFVHNEHPAALREETLEQMQAYGIGQMLLPLPNFKKDGTFKLTRKELKIVPAWVASTASYNAANGTHIVAVASIGGKVKGASLDLEQPAVRARMVAGVEKALSLGLGAVSLDLEPYPTTHGFVLLLSELNAAFSRLGFQGRLSVTAPATAGRWPPQLLEEITPLLGQLEPLFYDSERKAVPAYEQWVREGLAYYSHNTAPGTRIVPDLPSYGPNKWHNPSVENISTATSAVEEALAEGSRVNGAGVWWWWGFFYNEEGEGSYNGAADREAWISRTLLVPFTP